MTPLRKLIEQATPGPWCAPRELGALAVRVDDEHVARLAVCDRIEASAFAPFNVAGSSVANARLIALAPQLADLLDRAMESLKQGHGTGYDPDCATCQLIDEFALLSTSQPGDKT